ncbi:MAG TPA: hypothetical protein VFL42_05715 [Terriglobales bacterium]|nr:hypothetical protein [Terriglobales bacterium]
MRTFIGIILALAFLNIPFAGQEKSPRPQTASAAQTQPSKSQSAEIQALREDLQRMKELERQMESNLAFVDTAQSPLKHQFQLEIDMWHTMIASMERRLAAMPH